MKPPANFYYDIISPYVYFFLKLRKPLEALVDLKPVPIFFLVYCAYKIIVGQLRFLKKEFIPTPSAFGKPNNWVFPFSFRGAIHLLLLLHNAYYYKKVLTSR